MRARVCVCVCVFGESKMSRKCQVIAFYALTSVFLGLILQTFG